MVLVLRVVLMGEIGQRCKFMNAVFIALALLTTGEGGSEGGIGGGKGGWAVSAEFCEREPYTAM